MSACVPATRQTIHEAVTLNLIQMVNVIFIVDRRRLPVRGQSPATLRADAPKE